MRSTLPFVFAGLVLFPAAGRAGTSFDIVGFTKDDQKMVYREVYSNGGAGCCGYGYFLIDFSSPLPGISELYRYDSYADGNGENPEGAKKAEALLDSLGVERGRRSALRLVKDFSFSRETPPPSSYPFDPGELRLNHTGDEHRPGYDLWRVDPGKHRRMLWVQRWAGEGAGYRHDLRSVYEYKDQSYIAVVVHSYYGFEGEWDGRFELIFAPRDGAPCAPGGSKERCWESVYEPVSSPYDLLLGRSYLARKASQGDADALKEVSRLYGAEGFQTGDRTALMDAKDAAAVDLLVKSGVDVNFQNDHKKTALMIAAERGQAEVVETLLRHGADHRLADDRGMTALMLAVRSLPTVQALVAAGADVNAVNDKTNVFGWAVLGRDNEVCDFLAARGAKTEIQNPFTKEKETWGDKWREQRMYDRVEADRKSLGGAEYKFMLSAFYGHAEEEMKAVLRSSPSYARLAQADGTTALMLAAQGWIEGGVEALLRAGADVHAANERGVTALTQAVRHYNPPRDQGKVLGLLLDAGADVNKPTPRGATPLMLAVIAGRPDLVELLLKRGARTGLKDDNGWTAFDWARKNRRLKKKDRARIMLALARRSPGIYVLAGLAALLFGGAWAIWKMRRWIKPAMPRGNR